MEMDMKHFYFTITHTNRTNHTYQSAEDISKLLEQV